MSPGNGNSNPPDSLDDVSLVYFDANPTHLEPFEASRLRWKVDAPNIVQTELAGTNVAHVGEKPVEPPATRTYDLVAKARGTSKLLKRVQVTVDVSHCLVSDHMVGALVEHGLSDPGVLPNLVYFREAPKVTISPGQIQIHLFLGKQISPIRDPDITIDMSFGLTIAPDDRTHGSGLGFINAFGVPQTRLAPIAEVYTVSITEPLWYWALIAPWAPPIALALRIAQDGVFAQVPSIIQSVVDGLDADFHPDNFAGLAKHTVTIDVDDKNNGYLELNWCPPPPLLVKETE